MIRLSRQRLICRWSGADDPYAARNSALAVNFNTVNLAWNTEQQIISAEPQTPLTEVARSLGRGLAPGQPRRVNSAVILNWVWLRFSSCLPIFWQTRASCLPTTAFTESHSQTIGSWCIVTAVPERFATYLSGCCAIRITSPQISYS